MKLTLIRCFVAASLVLATVPAAASGKPAPDTDKRTQASSATNPAAPAKSAVSTKSTKQAQTLARLRTQEGLKLYEAGKWQEAFEKFQEAETLQHAPTRLLHVARCQYKLGKLLEARTSYERLLAEKLPANAPEALLDERARAVKELEIVQVRMPRVRIVLAGVAPQASRLIVDGKRVASIVNELELNPGKHTIELVTTNADHYMATFSVSEGRVKTINLVRRPRSAEARGRS
jgi:tetratricopeptide (TPR) repeat protein